MTANSNDLASRIAKLERKNRALMFCAFLAIVVVTAGFSIQGTRDVKTIEASRFVLRDATGVPRCELTCDQDRGTVRQVFRDSQGKERLTFTIDESNVARVRLYDDKDRLRVGVFSYPSDHATFPEQAGLALNDTAANQRATLLTDAQGDVRLRLSVTTNDERATMFVHKNGNSGWSISDENNRRIVSAVDPEKRAALQIWDLDGKESIGMCTTPDRYAFVNVANPKGDLKFVTGVAPNAAGRTIINDDSDDLIQGVDWGLRIQGILQLIRPFLGGG